MVNAPEVDDPSFSSLDEPRSEFIPEAGEDFVVTPYIQDLTNRAIAYLAIGYPVHLSGPAGTGKSTLAMHIASRLGRACTLLHGDDEYKASDLLGRDSGYQRSSTVDNYVSSIVKTEETLSVVWSSNRLTTACQKGHTLVYDEFTRSPAAANNPFLSILEEGILNISSSGKQKGYIKVHPEFRAIFTSNPEEYVGVHKTQDALLDRMITIPLDYQDRETESEIVRAKSDRTLEDAETIVDIVRSMRKRLGGMSGPTVRSAIAIGRILDFRKATVAADDPVFFTTCKDVLFYQATRRGNDRITEAEAERIIRSLGAESAPADAEPIEVPEAEAAAASAASEITEDVKPAEDLTEPSDDVPSEETAVAPGSPIEASSIPEEFASAQESSSEEDQSAESEAPSSLEEDSPISAKDESPSEEEADEVETQILGEITTLEETVAEEVRETPDLSSSLRRPFDDIASTFDKELPRPPSREASKNKLSFETPVENSQSDKASTVETDSETASPQLMLETAVSRFSRPPSPSTDAPPLSGTLS